jgi:hypothetical protein
MSKIAKRASRPQPHSAEAWSGNASGVVSDENGLIVCVAINHTDAPLIGAAPALLRAAQLVLSRWESGDLAQAVRELQAAVDQAGEVQS